MPVYSEQLKPFKISQELLKTQFESCRLLPLGGVKGNFPIREILNIEPFSILSNTLCFVSLCWNPSHQNKPGTTVVTLQLWKKHHDNNQDLILQLMLSLKYVINTREHKDE